MKSACNVFVDLVLSKFTDQNDVKKLQNLIPNYVVGCEDPNAETLFKLQVLNLERDVYSKPLELPYFVQQQFGVETVLVKFKRNSCE